MGWQPIETAPKDGTWIAVWRHPSEPGNGVTWSPLLWVRWDDADQMWIWPDDAMPLNPPDLWSEFGLAEVEDAIADGNSLGIAEDSPWGPTHWMPLPEPPEAS